MFKPFFSICILFCFLFHSQVYTQEALKTTFDSIYSNENLSSEDKIKETQQLLTTIDTLTVTPELGYTYHKLGLLYNSIQHYENAIQETLKAIHIRDSLKTASIDLNNSLYNTYIYYQTLGNIYKGRTYLEQILNNRGSDKFNFKALIELAFISIDEGDYFKALEYLEPVILSGDIYEDPKTLAYGHLCSIEVYSKMSMPTKYLDEVILQKEKIKSLDDYIQTKDIADMYTNLGTIFENSDQKEEATNYYNKALSIYIEAKDFDHIGVLYGNLGVLHSRNNEHQKAQAYYTKAIEINKDAIKKADVYNNQGYYLQTNDPKEKITYYQKAIYTALEETYDSTNIQRLPSIHSFKDYIYKPDVLEYLINTSLAWIEAYELEKNRTYLTHAKETLYLVDQLVSLIRLDSEVDQSKLFWINSGVDSYMLAVKVCYLLGQPDEAFYFMEKNKALLLLERLDKRYEQQNLDIPYTILEKEKALFQTRIALKQQLQSSKNDIQLQEEFVNADRQYTRFLDSLKITFPTYYAIKNEPEILSLQKSIEKHITNDTYLVEYILNASQGYGIFASKEATHFFEIKDAPKLVQQVQFLKKEISAAFTTTEDFQAYQKKSFEVFNTLFPFLKSIGDIENKRLIIIPDFELHNLPFAALTISNTSKNHKLDYLLHHTETSYLQSASVFKQIRKTSNIASSEILGFAPTLFEDKKLINLNESEEEMKKHASLISMKLHLKENATKTSFISSLKNASIIHINSHAGYTENSTPWLQLYDDKILLDELYDLENNTNLIILDACKGAQGNQEPGEGIMSLSRGFFYSGSQSVIASNWNVNETSNNKILRTFYEELIKGETKSKALYTSKKNYLNTHQLEQTSPYFWASTTLTGNNTPIKISDSSFLFKLISVGILIIIVVVIRIYKKELSKINFK
ncbi:CHAT domain-containing protein [uncultured Dokdonia sp.]|uniref:CHAT domain-containing protein n=1 Tax=uncultured Dokdonia sp. TaxID=575653 RepID=UPI00261ECB8D|nr:CHAT domain-containing protein [uncultured Dokdonia sp.]